MYSREIKEIAERVRERLETLNVHSLFEPELARIWGGGEGLSIVEKRMHVENFSAHFGFKVLVNDEATMAAFVKKDTIRAPHGRNQVAAPVSGEKAEENHPIPEDSFQDWNA